MNRFPRHFAVRTESYTPSFQNRLRPRQRLQCLRRRCCCCSERVAEGEGEDGTDEAAVGGSPGDH